ncbi:hypothetical protein ANANG_G00115430 [Anguilla anguilla]|uniref:Uncharacterized protein n=1 Tax=Anguilla anguilla TaxID=7936 RepID=A0A9D3MCH7_ANGAN|nr:hypothetical protein ANANG_G00115430 [Anguilla anguilla]
MLILRRLHKSGKLRMMALVRSSLQKVVVFLHRLQRMAISSPRYHKLCKSCVEYTVHGVDSSVDVDWLGLCVAVVKVSLGLILSVLSEPWSVKKEFESGGEELGGGEGTHSSSSK